MKVMCVGGGKMMVADIVGGWELGVSCDTENIAPLKSRKVAT